MDYIYLTLKNRLLNGSVMHTFAFYCIASSFDFRVVCSKHKLPAICQAAALPSCALSLVDVNGHDNNLLHLKTYQIFFSFGLDAIFTYRRSYFLRENNSTVIYLIYYSTNNFH